MAGKQPGQMTREMHMVHTAFRREFGLVPDLVRGVMAGDREQSEIVADHIGVINLVLEEHHGGEDRDLWPRLHERCPEEIQPLVHGMEEQHRRIAELVLDLTTTLALWRTDGNAESRDHALNTLDQLLPVLREHLGDEEEHVLPLVEKYITGDEWDAMVATSAAGTPPDKMPLFFGIMMYEGDPAAIEDALNNMPSEVRAFIVEAAPRAYAEYATRLYGTPTPPLGSTLPSR
jgi:hemerythrin-like domain-containing protein